MKTKPTKGHTNKNQLFYAFSCFFFWHLLVVVIVVDFFAVLIYKARPCLWPQFIYFASLLLLHYFTQLNMYLQTDRQTDTRSLSFSFLIFEHNNNSNNNTVQHTMNWPKIRNIRRTILGDNTSSSSSSSSSIHRSGGCLMKC